MNHWVYAFLILWLLVAVALLWRSVLRPHGRFIALCLFWPVATVVLAVCAVIGFLVLLVHPNLSKRKA